MGKLLRYETVREPFFVAILLKLLINLSSLFRAVTVLPAASSRLPGETGSRRSLTRGGMAVSSRRRRTIEPGWPGLNRPGGRQVGDRPWPRTQCIARDSQGRCRWRSTPDRGGVWARRYLLPDTASCSAFFRGPVRRHRQGDPGAAGGARRDLPPILRPRFVRAWSPGAATPPRPRMRTAPPPVSGRRARREAERGPDSCTQASMSRRASGRPTNQC